MKSLFQNHNRKLTSRFIKNFGEVFFDRNIGKSERYFEYLQGIDPFQSKILLIGTYFFEYFYPITLLKTARFSQLSLADREKLVFSAEHSSLLLLRQLALKFKMVSSLIYFLEEENKTKINYRAKYNG